MNDPLSVLLIGDYAIIRHGLGTLLAKHNIKVVGDSAPGEHALNLVNSLQPHIVLLDAPLASPGGLQLAQQIQQNNPGCRVVMLSGSHAEVDVRAAFEAQVSGYVCKTSDPEKLVNTLRLVAAGETVFPHCALKTRYRPQQSDTAAGNLTHREWQILHCVARGLANKGIARELKLAEGTVKVHIKAILRKLELANRTQAAVYVLRQNAEVA